MGIGLYVSKSIVKELSITEASYIAGILDGEGHITITSCQRRGKQKLNCVVGVSNNSNELLNWIKEKTGCGNIYHRSRFHNEGCVWTVSGKYQIISLLKQLVPYLIIKKEQALLAVSFCETITVRRNGVYRLDENVMIIRNEIRSDMLKLNKQLKFGGIVL